jgi:hypothetical protein
MPSTTRIARQVTRARDYGGFGIESAGNGTLRRPAGSLRDRFAVFAAVVGRGRTRRSAFALRELATALDAQVCQMHRLLDLGERAWDTVYYFETPSLDLLRAQEFTFEQVPECTALMVCGPRDSL